MSGYLGRVTDWIQSTQFSTMSTPRTIVHLPQDVFNKICMPLSIRDILNLRMSNKRVAGLTRDFRIWATLLYYLNLRLPVFSASLHHGFGDTGESMHELLTTRAICLDRNWNRNNPVTLHHFLHTYTNHTLEIKILPGGKYMLTLNVELTAIGAKFYIRLWDLNYYGQSIPLMVSQSHTQIHRIEAQFGTVNNLPGMFIASQTTLGSFVRVRVIRATIIDIQQAFETTGTLNGVFATCHQTLFPPRVSQIVLGSMKDDMVLAVVNRPYQVFFYYLNSQDCGSLALCENIPGSRQHAVMSIKLLTNQNMFIMTRAFREPDPEEEGKFKLAGFFALDMFPLPRSGIIIDDVPLSRQFIEGLQFQACYFSDLDTSWFASLHDLEGLLPTPENKEPPPISIFVTTKKPRGFVHFLLLPRAVPGHFVSLAGNRGEIPRYEYAFPLVAMECSQGSNDNVIPHFLPGAYRTAVVSQQVHARRRVTGVVTPWVQVYFCAHTTRDELYREYGSTSTVDNVTTWSMTSEDMAKLSDITLRISAVSTTQLRARTGIMALAFEESVGRLYVAPVGGLRIHVLDFGGVN